jgi:hypothetical protein
MLQESNARPTSVQAIWVPTLLQEKKARSLQEQAPWVQHHVLA